MDTVKTVSVPKKVIKRETKVEAFTQTSWQPVTNWKNITHLWFPLDDYRQPIVKKAYQIWWMDLVIQVECENWSWNPFAVWDHWHAFWLCQMNNNYHTIPQEYSNDRWYQLEYCNQKRLWGTKFYGPSRIIKWQKCSSYVLSRFKIN